MSGWIWITLIFFVAFSSLGVFVWIARKGRKLRRSLPLPPQALHASLQWSEENQVKHAEISPPFYLGASPDSNIILRNGRISYEACIFYHRRRFAIQSMEGAGELLVNGEETLAVYLADGDTVEIAGIRFTFHCG